MFALVEAIATAIENRVVVLRNVTEPVASGATAITLDDLRGYNPGDTFILYEDQTAELHTVACLSEQIHVAEPVSVAFTTDAKTQKVHDTSVITTVHRGEPPSIPLYPAITVTLSERLRSPLTLSDVEDSYGAIIRVYVDVTSDYETQYALLLDLTAKIEQSLFIPLYLRIPPFFETTLDEPIEAGDTLIKLRDPLPSARQVIIEDATRSRIRTLVDGLGNNVYELNYAMPAFPWANVIQLLVHSYNPE